MVTTWTRTEGASVGRRRTSLRALLVLLLGGLAVLVAPGAQTAARADGPVTLDYWQTFLAEHPELDVAAGSGAAGGAGLTAGEAGVAFASGLGEGILLIGGTYVVARTTDHVLHLIFGHDGDMRSKSADYIIGTTAWSFLNPYGGGPKDVPNLGAPGPHLSFYMAIANNAATTKYLDIHYDCWNTDPSTGYSADQYRTHTLMASGDVWDHNLTCGSSYVRRMTFTEGVGGPKVYQWQYDATPNTAWNVQPHQTCRSTSGTRTTLDGTLLPIVPAGDLAANVVLPECPAGTSPEVSYVTGGRTGQDSPVGVLVAMPSTRTATSAATGTSTGTGTGTGTGGSTTPAPDPTAPPSGGDCFPSGWGLLNPVEWVYRPASCAISWAFVPSPTAMSEAQLRVQGGWTQNGLGAWVGSITGSVTALTGITSGSDGCSGPSWSLSFPHLAHAVHFAPFDACGSPMREAAVVVHLFLSIAAVLFGVRVCRRPLLSALGMGEA